LFADAQLLISAQCLAAEANALFGAAALDLPRRGVMEMEGGMGAIARALAGAVERFGGRVLYRQEAVRIRTGAGGSTRVETARGKRFPAEIVIANLPLSNLAGLLGRSGVEAEPPSPRDGWGAFMLHVGIDEGVVPDGMPLHHQVVAREPLGEGNSLFLSISPPRDAGRAPAGRRALTISTHTELGPWWRLFRHDRPAYEERKRRYTGRVLEVAKRVLPGLRNAADLVLPGTPVTFRRFTRRDWGWVGGYPQNRLGRALGPRLGGGIWMVGDSVFPGQSTAAVAMGGMRVARSVLEAIGRRERGDS
jgi:phytoene dehydrogenase-like protein